MASRWKRLIWILLPVAGFLLVVGALYVLIGRSLTEEERVLFDNYIERQRGLIVLGSAAGAALLGYIGLWLYGRYPAAVRSIASETAIMARSEQLRELEVTDGVFEIRKLADSISELVRRGQALQSETDARVGDATASLEIERNRLAALMAELDQAVIACNTEGRILLYNQRAKALCRSGGDASHAPTTLVGLGRSVFAVIPQEVVAHAITRMEDAIARREVDAAALPESVTVTVALDDGRLLRVRFATVMQAEVEEGVVPEHHGITGLVLLLEDVSRQVKTGQQRYRLLHQLTESSRAGIGNIRAAVETLQQFPDMPQEQQRKFIDVVHDEARLLSDAIDSSISAYSESLRSQWPLEEIRSADLMAVLVRNLDDQLAQAVACDPADDELWLTADSYALTLALVAICNKTCAAKKVRDLCLGIRRDGQFAQLDLVWRGDAVRVEDVRAWEETELNIQMAGNEVTVRHVLERHGGELWAVNESVGCTGIRLLLPTSEPPKIAASEGEMHQASRPEFYDFDLFSQIGAHPDLETRRLDELNFTVFDTETTGLDTNRDEIISIGALRIVNGRLLQTEVFEQLVDPGCSITREAEAVHGITQDMLQGKPGVTEALSDFHRFCEDTVLVGHNAAFDMRFLQRANLPGTMSFSHPVLDTLLLSAVIYPERGEHSLEKIAKRFDVPIIGRHTALGDAIVTGQVFLRMLSLLRQQGLHTLGDVMKAAKDTYLARVKY